MFCREIFSHFVDQYYQHTTTTTEATYRGNFSTPQRGVSVTGLPSRGAPTKVEKTPAESTFSETSSPGVLTLRNHCQILVGGDRNPPFDPLSLIKFYIPYKSQEEQDSNKDCLVLLLTKICSTTPSPSDATNKLYDNNKLKLLSINLMNSIASSSPHLATSITMDGDLDWPHPQFRKLTIER